MSKSKNPPDGDEIYQAMIETVRERGLEQLGFMTSWAWYDDPKRLAFTLSRYKFVSRILEGSDRVLEVGCGDGFGSRIVRQSVGHVLGIDFDPEFINAAIETASDKYPVEFQVHDMMSGPVEGEFDGIYSMDVLEHISPDQEEEFLKNTIVPLTDHGVCIIGMPSLQSQTYASKLSKAGHINCKDQPATKALMEKFFHNVFMFSMNDEVVHTGYQAMSHYNIALCCGKIS